ncbi:hypothetical protein AAG570_009513 [Ranatra chinensis]|uniref:Uncharacterized protein n=1 Tax=Ranatra chinensis TaxID=642074 RepID=A0ABD0Z054_9HEMI
MAVETNQFPERQKSPRKSWYLKDFPLIDNWYRGCETTGPRRWRQASTWRKVLPDVDLVKVSRSRQEMPPSRALRVTNLSREKLAESFFFPLMLTMICERDASP